MSDKLNSSRQRFSILYYNSGDEAYLNTSDNREDTKSYNIEGLNEQPLGPDSSITEKLALFPNRYSKQLQLYACSLKGAYYKGWMTPRENLDDNAIVNT
jgi:hypothetical protein